MKTKFDKIERVLRENDLGSVDSLQFVPQVTNPDYQEGLVFYDDSKKALSYYNDAQDITVNLGQELLFRVENRTGATISNGSVVSPNSKTIITLADAQCKDKSRIIAVATHEIEDESFGYVTKFGQVGGLDTSAYSEGTILYLSKTNPGGFTNIRPDDGVYSVIVGVVNVSDPTDGIITVDTRSSDLTVEVNDVNGFPPDQRSNMTLSMDNGSRTFTVSSSSYPYHYYMTGDKYEKEESDSIVLPDTEGLKAVYYDGDTLSYIDNPNDGQISQAIRTKATVAYIYWDADNSEYNYFGEELHGISMSPDTHSYLHFTRGAQFLSGLALNTIVADGDGDINTSAQFGVDSGFYADEDLLITTDSIASTVGLPIYYLDGTNNLRRTTMEGLTDGYSVLTDIEAGVDTTGRLVFNEFTGGVWQLTTITNNDFVLCHVFAINGQDTDDQIIAFIGQSDYLTRGAARAGAETEISNLLTVLPVQEIIPLGTVIFQTSNGYDNEVKARVISTEEGDDYVDWRTSELQAGAAPSSHNNLASLELAASGVTYGHINDQAQTIYGAKTFDSAISAQNIESGRYTPTLTAVTNVNVSGAYAGHYLKIDNEVSVFMRVNVDPTTAATTTELGISLPIASSLTSTQDAGGVGSQSDTNSNGIISADTTNNRVTLKFESIDTTNRDWWLTFAYQVK